MFGTPDEPLSTSELAKRHDARWIMFGATVGIVIRRRTTHRSPYRWPERPCWDPDIYKGWDVSSRCGRENGCNESDKCHRADPAPGL